VALEERVSKLEGTTEQILERLNSLENRMDARFNSLEARMDARFNTQMTIFVGMWVTTMAFTLATLVAVLLRT
jgi:tetrahydromethanopterin S-methyltransferase subunit B